jgi:MarR family transcriptional regulator, organic hydroperoxide resistance regulator
MLDDNHGINRLEHLLFALNQRLNHITRAYLSPKGLSMPRFWVLRRLSPDQAITMGDLQRQMLLAPATITGLVDALVEMGLVKRSRNEEDRRLVFLNLTPVGKTLVDDALKYRASVLQAALEDQPGMEAEFLVDYVDKIYKSLEKTHQL